jgi:formate-nitrite transporter family protein
VFVSSFSVTLLTAARRPQRRLVAARLWRQQSGHRYAVAIDEGAAGRTPEGIADSEATDSPETEDLTPESAFKRTVEDGRRRIQRPIPALVATGIVGGMDIGTGILGLLLVEQQTDNPLLAGLAFGIAFVALLLAQSELFTEGFLVPVSAVIARKATVRGLLKLWGLTIVANLLGGWVITWLLMLAFPQLHGTAIKAASHFVDLGFTTQSFALAILAGVAMTMLTWMQNGTESIAGKLVAAWAIAWLLAGGQLYHSILDSLLMFAALHTGHAPFGYLAWFERFWWAAAGNILGGIGLVTTLRLVQVHDRVAAERAHPGV